MKRKLFREGDIQDFYVIEEDSLLGEGGSAVVRKGIKRDSGESYAIKILDKLAMGETERENLYNELNIMSIVDHPNIVRVYEYYESLDIVFIVMELMLGGELFDRIVHFERYTEKQAADSFRPIVDAVRYCHSLNIVHRDLKPENLLYAHPEDDALIKVSDFGLAKFMITKDMLFTACGTPNYVAPEIIEAKGYDSKVDCWSLGVILYVMLCGFPPFYHDESEQLFEQIKKGTFDFPSPYWDAVSDHAKDLITKLIINDSAKRLSADQILKHPWLVGSNDTGKELQFQANTYKSFKAHRIKYAIMASMIIKLWQKITFNKNK